MGGKKRKGRASLGCKPRIEHQVKEQYKSGQERPSGERENQQPAYAPGCPSEKGVTAHRGKKTLKKRGREKA